jgi:hypothetical protein
MRCAGGNLNHLMPALEPVIARQRACRTLIRPGFWRIWLAVDLLDVSAQSPTDAWAVGGTYWFEPTQAAAYHWNGKTWSQVPTPTPGGTGYFNAVAETSPSNAWAVG